MANVPTDAKQRKSLPVCTGVIDYFADALLAVAEVSRVGNEQHNPGQPIHWAKEKSTDEADALMRHLIDRGKRDSDGLRHSAKVAWRALALLQREIEADKGLNIEKLKSAVVPEWKTRTVSSSQGPSKPGQLCSECGEAYPYHYNCGAYWNWVQK